MSIVSEKIKVTGKQGINHRSCRKGKKGLYLVELIMFGLMINDKIKITRVEMIKMMGVSLARRGVRIGNSYSYANSQQLSPSSSSPGRV